MIEQKKTLEQEINSAVEENAMLKEKMDKVNKKFDKLHLLIEKKGYGKTKREKTPTSCETINDSANCTRYSRQAETKDLLSYIHGGVEAALYGAWDFLRRYVRKELIEKFILENKRGKFFEHLHGKFGVKPEQSMNRAIALKYQTYLSHRKYKFVCKIQSSIFDIENQKWNKNIISYGDRTINICDKTISTYKITKFIESLDIGDINTTPGHCGASRSVTALTTMIIDLNIRIPELRNKLMWFNGVENHFIMQFAADGAPESRDRSIHWNP